jgi:hypothetical protein
MKLCVKFPTTWPGWNTPFYTLDSAFDNSTPGLLTAVVEPKVHCDYYADSPVFRASLQIHDASNPRSTSTYNVALKFAMRSDLAEGLAREAELYEGLLQPLQGTTVPRCRGFYVGTNDEGDEIACLVLDYWGECLRTPFSRTPTDIR